MMIITARSAQTVASCSQTANAKMTTIRNQYGKVSHNQISEICGICGKPRWMHTQAQAEECKRALTNAF